MGERSCLHGADDRGDGVDDDSRRHVSRAHADLRDRLGAFRFARCSVMRLALVVTEGACVLLFVSGLCVVLVIAVVTFVADGIAGRLRG